MAVESHFGCGPQENDLTCSDREVVRSGARSGILKLRSLSVLSHLWYSTDEDVVRVSLISARNALKTHKRRKGLVEEEGLDRLAVLAHWTKKEIAIEALSVVLVAVESNARSASLLFRTNMCHALARLVSHGDADEVTTLAWQCLRTALRSVGGADVRTTLISLGVMDFAVHPARSSPPSVGGGHPARSVLAQCALLPEAQPVLIAASHFEWLHDDDAPSDVERREEAALPRRPRGHGRRGRRLSWICFDPDLPCSWVFMAHRLIAHAVQTSETIEADDAEALARVSPVLRQACATPSEPSAARWTSSRASTPSASPRRTSSPLRTTFARRWTRRRSRA